ncbi:MAG TPA: Xaa-Pro peptidase family protein [Isosphaeraceae bacterium]|nr:Xaa-Pro peptidase family protein [Isosphaeraceae bacterium]
MLRITQEEYRRRLERLETAVAEAGLDVFLVSSFDSIYYLTGAGFEPLERPFFLAVYPRGVRGSTLLVPRLDAEHMKKARNVAERRTYWEHPAPEGRRWLDGLWALIGHAGRVGIEPSLRRDIADELCGLTTEVTPLVEGLRAVKSPDEVAMIRRTVRYADRGVEALLAAAYYGATAAEGFARTGALSRTIIREVDDWEILTTRVLLATWASPTSAQPHSVPDLNDRLREGPHVALSFLRVNGYAAECERTFFTAPPSQEGRRAFRAMEEARGIAFRMIRPGVACGELDQAVNEFLRAEGYAGEECRLHRTGHGIGLGNHEAPWVAEGSTDVFAENMVISVEPGIYLKGECGGGFRHSDTVLVTRDGCECLTRYRSKIDDLTIRGWRPRARLIGALIRRALRLNEKAGLARESRRQTS